MSKTSRLLAQALCLLLLIAVRSTFASEVRSVTVAGNNDLVYDPATQQLYVTLGNNPGQIVAISPVLGTVGNPVTIGIFPTTEAVTDDGSYIYIAANSSTQLLRYNPVTQSVDQTLTFGGLSVEDFQPVPTQPHSVAVIRANYAFSPHFAGTYIYDDTTARTNHTDGWDQLVFSSATKCWNYQNSLSSYGFAAYPVDSNGYGTGASLTGAISGPGYLRYDNGRIYFSGGTILSAADGSYITYFNPLNNPFILDSPDGLLWTLTGSGASTTINSYDETNYILNNSYPISGIAGSVGSFVKWGTNAFAFRSYPNTIYLVQLFQLAPPTALTATGKNNSVALSWTGVGTAISYRVYRGTTPLGENAVPIATGIAGTTYSDTSAANGTTYYYKVVAENADGTSDPSNEASAAATPGTSHFVVTAPPSATAGVPFSFTVTAKDAFDNTVTGYGGVAHFSSSDGLAVLPTDRRFSGGVGTFTAVLKTAGTQTISANDVGLPVINGTSGSIGVGPNGASHFGVSAPASATAGRSFSFTVTALDAYGNVVPTYGGLAHFTSSDPQAILPSDRRLTSGVGTFTAALGTAGTQTISANDVRLPVVAGTSGSIAVSPNGTSHLVVAAPVSSTAGRAFTVTITAKDAYGNTVPTYHGLIDFSSTDPQAVLPGNQYFPGGGTLTAPATLKTAGSQTVSVNDVGLPVISGTSAAIAVGPSGTSHFDVVGPPAVAAGSAFTVSVTARDAYGNVVPTYHGVIHFTSSDPAAVLPPNQYFPDGGVASFPVTLPTGGLQTVSANDGAAPIISGSTGPIAVTP